MYRFSGWILLSPRMPKCLCKTVCTHEFFLREDPFQQVTKRCHRGDDPSYLVSGLPHTLTLGSRAPPRPGLSSHWPTLWQWNPSFKAGWRSASHTNLTDISTPSLAPRNPGQVLRNHHMAIMCPPDFMMHDCSTWRSYRQVPLAGFFDISMCVQPIDELRCE